MELYNQSPSCGLDSCRAVGVSKYVSNGQFKLDQSFDAHSATPSQTMNVSPNSSDSYTVKATQYGVFPKCNVCNISCTSQVSFEQHLSGALHRKNVQPHVQWKCQLCNLEFTDCSQLEAHMQGSRHARKVKRTALNESDQSDESSTKSSVGESVYCPTCQLFLSSNSQFQSHVAGRKHQNRMKLKHHYSATEPVGIRTPLARQSNTSSGMCSLRLSSACKNVATQTDIDCVIERIQVSESGVSPAHISVVPCYLQAYGSDSSATMNSPSNSTSSATPSKVDSSQPLCAHESCIISRALEFYEQSVRHFNQTSSFSSL